MLNKKVYALIIFFTYIYVTPVFAVDSIILVGKLAEQYGKIISVNTGEETRDMTFSSKFQDISKVFDIMENSSTYIAEITVYGINEQIASVTVKAELNSNKKVDVRKKSLYLETVMDRHIPWPRSDEALKEEAKKRSIFAKKKIRNELSVTSISTDFKDDIIVKGTTYQSKIVFTELFKTLNSIPAISAPFFERGTYYDVEDGRKMEYTIRCKWGQNSVKPKEENCK